MIGPSSRRMITKKNLGAVCIVALLLIIALFTLFAPIISESGTGDNSNNSNQNTHNVNNKGLAGSLSCSSNSSVLEEKIKELERELRKRRQQIKELKKERNTLKTQLAEFVLPPVKDFVQPREGYVDSRPLAFKERRNLDSLPNAADSPPVRCGPLFSPGCICNGSFPGSLCGPDPSGSHRCSKDLCIVDGFRPLPMGFPRRYVTPGGGPLENKFIPWQKNFTEEKPEHPLAINQIHKDPRWRRRRNLGVLRLKCVTHAFQGITNQELSLAQCLLLGYQLNASQVFQVGPLTRVVKTLNVSDGTYYESGDVLTAKSEPEDLFDWNFLQESAEKYGIEVHSMNAQRMGPYPVLKCGKRGKRCCGIMGQADGNAEISGNPYAFEWTAFGIQELKKRERVGPALTGFDRIEADVQSLSLTRNVSDKSSTLYNYNCTENVPVMVHLNADRFGSYTVFRHGQFLPTADWLRPSTKVRAMVVEARENIRQGKGFIGGGNHRSPLAAASRPIQIVLPRIRPNHEPKEEVAEFNHRFQKKVEAFRSRGSVEGCEFMAVHLRYEPDARMTWGAAAGNMDQMRYDVLRAIDELAEALGCSTVVLSNKPLNRWRIKDKMFLESAWANYIVTGEGMHDDDGVKNDGIVAGAVSKHGKSVLVQQMADRTLISEADVAVIWDPFQGVSSFSHRIYDIRCRGVGGEGQEGEEYGKKNQLTFSYSTPFSGELTPEC